MMDSLVVPEIPMFRINQNSGFTGIIARILQVRLELVTLISLSFYVTTVYCNNAAFDCLLPQDDCLQPHWKDISIIGRSNTTCMSIE